MTPTYAKLSRGPKPQTKLSKYPDFSEYHTDGDDLDDAVNMAAEALELVIESHIENGREERAGPDTHVRARPRYSITSFSPSPTLRRDCPFVSSSRLPRRPRSC